MSGGRHSARHDCGRLVVELFWAKENALQPLPWSWCLKAPLQCTSRTPTGQGREGRPLGGIPQKTNLQSMGREGAEQQLFSLCVTSVQLDALGLVVKSFGDDSGKCTFPLSFLLTDRQF